MKRISLCYALLLWSSFAKANDDRVKTREIETTQLKVAEKVSSKNADFKGDVKMNKGVINTITIADQLNVKGSTNIIGSMMCKGKASFTYGLEAKGDVSIQKAKLNNLETDRIVVKRELTSENIVVNKASLKSLQSSSSNIEAVEAQSITVKTLAARSVKSGMAEVEQKLVAKSIEVSDISVASSMSVAGSLHADDSVLSGSLKAKSVESGMLSVKGEVQAQSLFSHGVINASSTIYAKGSILVNDRVEVKGNINASSIHVGELAISPTANNFGCIEVESDSVKIAGNISVSENMFVEKTVSVGELDTSNITAKNINTDNFHSNGIIESSKGFASNGTLTIENITAGSLAIDGRILAQELNVQSNLSASNAAIETLIAQESLVVESNATFEGDVLFRGGNAQFSGETLSATKLIADTVKSDGIETNSVITKRVYAKDVLANGFVSAAEIQSKGNIKVNGLVDAKVVNANEIVSSEIVASGQVRSSTARVDGSLEAAGISAQKITIGEIDLLAVIESLQIRVAELESKFMMYQKDSEEIIEL